MSDYKFKHWQSFNCITKTVDTVKETVRTEYTWNWKRIQRISSSAEQKSTHSYEGSEKIKESTEILARLETLLEEELIVGITYSSMTEITEEVELNCGKNEFGLMKDMIRISFMDDVVNLVLGEIIYSQETLSNVYFINTLNNEHYDESFYELAKNKVILSRANISGFQVLEYDDYYSKIMSEVIYNYARIEPNKIHDNMLSSNPNAATSLYAKIGPKFRAPLVPVSGWIPLYTYSVWTGHGEDHYYSVDGNDESQILCYIAKDISAGPNLVPLVEFYDTSKIYKDHNYGLCLSCGTGTMIGVLGYVYPLD